MLLHHPGPALRPFVRSVLWYSGYSGTSSYERLLPDGLCQLILPLDPQPRQLVSCSSATISKWNTAYLCGLQTEAITYVSEQQASTLCIQLEPVGLAKLLQIPANECINQQIDLSLFLHDELRCLQDQLREWTDGNQIVRHTLRVLSQWMTSNWEPDEMVCWIQRQLMLPNIKLKDVAKQVGCSQKQLIYRFQRQIGVTPKLYQRLMRFNHSLSYLHTASKPNLQDLVFDLGYYDQAHFSNDFKVFAKLSPRQYLQHSTPYPHVMELEAIPL